MSAENSRTPRAGFDPAAPRPIVRTGQARSRRNLQSLGSDLETVIAHSRNAAHLPLLAFTNISGLRVKDTPLPSLRRAFGTLHRKFVLKTLAVASDSGNGERLAFALKGELAIVIFDTAVQIEPVPLLRVTDVVEGKIELCGPEKRYGVEPLALTQYVAGRGLSLALSYHPMLDANTIASERIGPASDVAGGENARDAGFEMLVDQYAAIRLDPGALGNIG